MFDCDDDEIVSVASSCAGEMERDNMDIESTEANEDVDESDDMENDDGKIVNLRRREFNPLALKDIYSTDNKTRCKKAIKKQRHETITRRERQLQLIDNAVKFFKSKMEKRRSNLEVNIEKGSSGNYKRPLLGFELKYKEYINNRN